MRIESLEKLLEIDFDGYAMGGLAVGEKQNEMFKILDTPFFCFHDADIRPEGNNFSENTRNLEEMIDYFSEKMAVTNTKLLWGTANLFSNRRYMSGAATNPDPDVFAFSAATIKTCLDATHKLGGAKLCSVGRPRGI